MKREITYCGVHPPHAVEQSERFKSDRAKMLYDLSDPARLAATPLPDPDTDEYAKTTDRFVKEWAEQEQAKHKFPDLPVSQWQHPPFKFLLEYVFRVYLCVVMFAFLSGIIFYFFWLVFRMFASLAK
jgi:hypothetical protein